MLVTDLSDWNDHINWSHMIGEGVEGVIVKISKGARSLNFTANTLREPLPVDSHGEYTATLMHKQQHGQRKKLIE